MTVDYEAEFSGEEAYEAEYVAAAVKPETVGHGVPGWEAQTVRPEPGCVFSSFEMEGMQEPTERAVITANGEHHVERVGIADVQVPQGVFPAGTLPINKNGIYTVSEYNAVNVQVQQSHEPVLLASVDVAQLAENVNRVVFHPTDFDLSAFRSIYFVCDGVRFTAQDWLYFTVADATAYTSKMLDIGTRILCFARMGTNWACAVKFATPNAYDNAGNRLGLGDIAMYPYSAATKFVKGTVSLYGL